MPARVFRARQPTFELGLRLEGVRGGFLLARESPVRVRGECTLTTSDVPERAAGAQGWSLSLKATGAIPLSVTTAGTAADLDVNGGFRRSASFELSEVTGGPGNEGITSTVVLDPEQAISLPAAGTQSVAAFEVEVVSDLEDGPAVELLYHDGLVGSRGPVANTVTWESRVVPPLLERAGTGQPVENIFVVGGESWSACTCLEAALLDARFVEASSGVFIRGDANDDLRVNIADAVWILAELFRGGLRTACLDAADANDDGSIDLTDAISIVDYRFRGNRQPPAPFPDCGTDSTDDTGDGDPANDLDCPRDAGSCW